MKKLLAILAILASPVLAQEPDTTPAATAAFITLPCDHSSKVFDILKANNERLVFAGDSLITSSQMGRMYEVGLYVWMNLDTRTSSVTILFPNSNHTMCLLAPVKNMQPWADVQPWEMPKGKKQSY